MPGENGVVVVALAVVVVELAMVEVELAGAVVVVLAGTVEVEPDTELVVELAAEVVVEMATVVVVVGMSDVVVVVFGFDQPVTGYKKQTSDSRTMQVFFMVLSPLLIEIHSAYARGNVARCIAG